MFISFCILFVLFCFILLIVLPWLGEIKLYIYIIYTLAAKRTAYRWRLESEYDVSCADADSKQRVQCGAAAGRDVRSTHSVTHSLGRLRSGPLRSLPYKPPARQRRIYSRCDPPTLPSPSQSLIGFSTYATPNFFCVAAYVYRNIAWSVVDSDVFSPALRETRQRWL